jgi:phage FluMu protein Com
MVTNVKCEHCGKLFEAEVEGKTTYCPHCGNETRFVTGEKPPSANPHIPSSREPAKTTQKQPEFSNRKSQIQNAVSFLQLAALLSIAGFLFLIWHQQQLPLPAPAESTSANPAPAAAPALPQWEYDKIEWTEKRFDREDHPGQILVTKIQIESELYTAKGQQAVDIDALLTVIGRFGWELVCFDGKYYIVKRPRQWRDGQFSTSDEWETIPKSN